MYKAEALINEYRKLFGSDGKSASIDPSQTEHLKVWIENKAGIRISKPLFVTSGQGGGQKYRLLYLLQAAEGNAGRQAVFYSEMSSLNDELKNKFGHIPLEELLINGGE